MMAAHPARQERQLVETAGGTETPLGGSFTLSFGGHVTESLAFDASAEGMQLPLDGPSLRETTSIRSLASDELAEIAEAGLYSLEREESANRKQHEAADAAAAAAGSSSSGDAVPAPPPIERSKTPVAPSVRLASAFFATFAALSIGTLARAKRS